MARCPDMPVHAALRLTGTPHSLCICRSVFFSFKDSRQSFEALLIPFTVENRPVVTVWVVTHNEEHKFDQEDERIIRTLAQFAAAGWQLWQAQGTAESATASARELTKDLAAANETLQVQVDSRMRAEQSCNS
jgi:hypothetical protein